MSSSERGHFVRTYPTRLAADEPFHAGHARDLVGNVNHLADQYAQRRVAWVALAASHYYEPDIGAASVAANEWYRCWSSTPFDLHVTEAGLSYALRVRVRAARSAGSGTITARAVVAAAGRGRGYYGSLDNTNVAEGASASATHAWLTMSPSDGMIYLSESQVAEAAQDVATTDQIPGDTVTAQWLRCTVEVWARTTDTGSIPRISGCQVDEFYAP